MNRRTSFVGMLLVVAAMASGATACAGDDSQPAGTGGAGSGGAAASGGGGAAAGGAGAAAAGPAQLACETFCVTEDACDLETTVDDCTSYRCAGFEEESAGCLSALKAFFDCMNVAVDPCVTSTCETLELAYHDACG